MEKLEQLKKQNPNVKIKKFDISEHSRIEEFIDDVSLELGGLDILINNAGIFAPEGFAETTDEAWDSVLETNLTAPVFLTRRIFIS